VSGNGSGNGTGRGMNPPPHGATLWFTGLPSAGKSTIAHALADDLRRSGLRVQVLDGDEVRPHLSAGLGFTRDDQIGAGLLERNGHIAGRAIPLHQPVGDVGAGIEAEPAQQDD